MESRNNVLASRVVACFTVVLVVGSLLAGCRRKAVLPTQPNPLSWSWVLLQAP